MIPSLRSPGGVELELCGRQDHPLGDHPAQLGLLELGLIRHNRAGACHSDRLAGGHVGRAADDRRGLGSVGAEVHPADLQPVRVGVLLGAEHAPDHEALARAHALVMDRLDLRTGHRQALLDRAHVQVGVAVFAQPWQRDAHQNCSKKRRSFS